MAGSEVRLFARNPANWVLAHALDGIVACNAKKLSTRDKVSLTALPVMLAIATVATAMVVLPVMVPIGLGLGTLAGGAYAVYRFYQSRTTTAEKALKAMARGDYASATALFKAMLKSQYAEMTSAKWDSLKNISVPDMFQPRYKNSFNFANVRIQNDWLLFGELYGTCMLFQLYQELGKKKIAFKEVKERLDQAHFWMSQSLKKMQPWQADLSRKIEEAARLGVKPAESKLPVKGKSGAIALLKAIDCLQRIRLSTWHGDPSMHTKKFLSSLQPWISRSTVGPEGCQVYRRLMACKYVAEMQPKAQTIPQAVIDKIEALVK